jgi:RNA polymerase sigma-70 factor (ECF subfamily)
MTEEKLLHRLRRHKQDALEALIGQYNNYVCAVIINTLGQNFSQEDVKEIASDVFLAVWDHADAIHLGKLKAYLGTAARNKSKDFRRKQQTLPMDLDEVPALTDGKTPESQLLRQEQQELVRKAVLELPQPDREIFLRYYYYLQTSAQIAEAMGMEDSTVRGRLMRGRNHLKQMLLKEGIV